MWSVTSSCKFKEDDVLQSSSSVCMLKKDHATHLKVLQLMRESFAKAVYYRTYRLKKRFQWNNSKIAWKVAKLLMNLRSQLKKTDFDEMAPISILAFTKEFSNACDSINICEGVATWFVSYIMMKPASSSLEAQLSPKKICAKGLHDERVPSYVEVVNYLLSAFETDYIIALEIKEIESYMQAQRVSAVLNAKKL